MLNLDSLLLLQSCLIFRLNKTWTVSPSGFLTAQDGPSGAGLADSPPTCLGFDMTLVCDDRLLWYKCMHDQGYT